MGRRALRKIDPSLDLSRHLLEFEQLPRPWSAEAIFGRIAPLEIEVGSGKGLFLRNAARSRPDVDFLGIEIAHKYARFAAAGLAKAGLPNGRVVPGDGTRIFAELVPDCSLAAVHVYFPDPWWKKRHRKRRLMNETFMRHIERTLLPGGTLHFWTDVRGVFPGHAGTIGRPHAAFRADPRAGNAGRARSGLSHALRAADAALQRARLSGRVQEGHRLTRTGTVRSMVAATAILSFNQ